MIKKMTYSTECPTKDKTVTLTVNYIFARCLEDGHKTPYVKGTLESCSACNGLVCKPCKVHTQLDNEIYL